MSDEPFLFTWSAQRNARGLAVVGGEGVFFDTADGDRWLDFGSLTYNANLGHGDRRMIDAIVAQANKFCLSMPSGVYEEKRALARRLLALAGEGFTKVFFTLGGADANENAIKIARLATSRHKLLSRYRSYHGGTMGALSLTGDYRRPPLEPGLVGAVRVDDREGTDPDAFARALAYEGNVAAVFLESVPGANGVLIPPSDYWPRVREACTKHGALLVADEVLCGFGRTGRWFGYQHWDVEPDMITLSKGITGGYATLGAVLIHDRVARHFEDHTLLAGLTQYAHPLGIAAALEAVRIYEADGLIERAATLEPELARGLAGIVERCTAVTSSRCIGLLGALDLGADVDLGALKKALEKERVHAFVRTHERAIVVAPPLCISEAELTEGCARIERAIASLSR
ncbi:MAG: aminotransferase class III-fold pyridoxal phosphate-dependent enzyme [Sandaracinaceae bacterium]